MKNYKNSIKLRSIKKSDCTFLYELLKERDPRVNISHKKMPNYTQHVKFVMSMPYSKWYIVEYHEKDVGSVYLTKDNEIGIFIKKGMSGKSIGFNALKLLIKKNPSSRYLANVNPKNKKSIRFFENNSFNLIQYTYTLEGTNLENFNNL